MGKDVVQITEKLPEHLQIHFLLARDLLSVDIPEMGAFAALRGLEATLRAIVRQQRVELLEKKGESKPLAEVDLYDVIEGARRLRWKTDNTSVLHQRVGTLLHHLRVSRNAIAHDDQDQSDSWEDTARLAAKEAASLWTRYR